MIEHMSNAKLRFYTPERIGPKRSLTPEGFLLCEDVPIARTGAMLYVAGEVPIDASRDGTILIERNADQVFRPETLASFVGKPVTDDHPPEEVNPSNWKAYARGHLQNVRQGGAGQEDFLFADLLITDASAIKAVTDGKIEVSCGYDAEYEQTDVGKGRQLNIIGNHVALVEQGRCGPRCAIGDSNMAVKKKTTFVDRVRAAFRAKDEASLEKELEELGTKTDDADGEEDEEDKDEAKKDGKTEDGFARVMDALSGIEKRLTSLETRKTADEASDEDDKEKTEDEDGDEEDKDEKTKDSAMLASDFQDTIARAEILAPGIKLPTFDGKATAKTTRDSLCALRRRALDISYSTTDGHARIKPLLTKDADFQKMTCDAVGLVFRAASEVTKLANNAGQKSAPSRDAKPGAFTVSDINSQNRAFWNTSR